MSELDKEALAAKYVELIEKLPEDERPAASMDVVAEVAKEFGIPINSARVHLTRAGVYIKKETAKKSASADGEKKAGGARTSKAAAHAELKTAFMDAGLSEDKLEEGADIIEKLTGKAAMFLAEAVRLITK